jgi:phage shock protein C
MKHIYKSKRHKKISGICGGIGETFDIDPTIIRLLAVFICFVTGILPLVLTYLVAREIVPEEPTV